MEEIDWEGSARIEGGAEAFLELSRPAETEVKLGEIALEPAHTGSLMDDTIEQEQDADLLAA